MVTIIDSNCDTRFNFVAQDGVVLLTNHNSSQTELELIAEAEKSEFSSKGPMSRRVYVSDNDFNPQGFMVKLIDEVTDHLDKTRFMPESVNVFGINVSGLPIKELVPDSLYFAYLLQDLNYISNQKYIALKRAALTQSTDLDINKVPLVELMASNLMEANRIPLRPALSTVVKSNPFIDKSKLNVA